VSARLRLVPAALAVAAGLAAPAAAPAAPPAISAPSAIVVDATTGDVAYAKDPDARRPIASTTKLMTALVALEDGDLDATVRAPRYRGLVIESRMGLLPGERIALADLVRGLLVASANDAAFAIADAVGGSQQSFVRRMNRRAQQLGLENTSFANPVGLDDPSNYSTARDLTTLTRELRRYAFFRRTVDAERVRLESGARPRTLENRNTLLLRAPWIDGVKTGFTSSAGDVLVASGKRRGVKLISAVLGEPSKPARDADSFALLKYGFSRYHRLRAVVRGDVYARVPIAHRAGAVLPLEASRSVRGVVRRGERFGYRQDVPAEVDGPISAGERVGRLVVTLRGEEVATVPLSAGLDVPAASVARKTQDLLTQPWILVVFAGLIVVLALASRARRPPPAREERPRRPVPDEEPVA
jgi:D-alanyl-D-alanine carboxypeptidase (penicillin-binding protein 5/6)